MALAASAQLPATSGLGVVVPSLRDSHRVGRVDLLEVMHAHARATALDWSRRSENGTDAMHVVRPFLPAPSSCAAAMHVGPLPPSAHPLALGAHLSFAAGVAGGLGRAFMKAPARTRKPRIPVLVSTAGMCGVARAGEGAAPARSRNVVRRAWCMEVYGVVCGAWLHDAVQQSHALVVHAGVPPRPVRSRSMAPRSCVQLAHQG
jgi:hypothetical protein